jgi:phosphatidylinositol kinase/protein kinase (PI-3  family)
MHSDIVDGMGTNGCEGTFRKSSEEVLRVLRENTHQVSVCVCECECV